MLAPRALRLLRPLGAALRPLGRLPFRLWLHRLWYVGALGVVGVGVYAGQALVVVAGVVALALSAAPELWWQVAPRSLSVEQELERTQAMLGETVGLRLRARNQGPTPLPWVTLVSDVPSALRMVGSVTLASDVYGRRRLRSTLALGAGRGARLRYGALCARRGVHRLGPLSVQISDPFGWLTQTRVIAARDETLLVFPLIAPLDAFNLPALSPYGALPTQRRLLDDPQRMAGVRPYAPGDDPRLIHWKATAHAGELRSKVFDPSGQYRLLIALDVNSYAQQRFGIDDDLLELSISVAASVAYWALDQGYATGLVSNGVVASFATDDDARGAAARPQDEHDDRSVWLAPSNTFGQRERIMSALARIEPVFGAPIESLIELRRRAFVAGTTVVLITTPSALRQEQVEYLMALQRHALRLELALVGATFASFPTPTHSLPTHRVGGKEVWHELLANALAHDAASDAASGGGRSLRIG